MSYRRIAWLTVPLILVALTLWGIHWWDKRKANEEGRRDQRIEQLVNRDSIIRHYLDSVGLRIDTVTHHTVTQVTAWDTLVRRVPVRVYDTITNTVVRVDSVYQDTAFAKLSPEEKVEVLRVVGSNLARTCSVLASTCQTFKDSAFRAFRVKDSLVLEWKTKYDKKPRRKCGPGGGVGVIAGLSSELRPVVGVGGALGLMCSL